MTLGDRQPFVTEQNAQRLHADSTDQHIRGERVPETMSVPENTSVLEQFSEGLLPHAGAVRRAALS